MKANQRFFLLVFQQSYSTNLEHPVTCRKDNNGGNCECCLMWARRLGSCLLLQIPAAIVIQLDRVNLLLVLGFLKCGFFPPMCGSQLAIQVVSDAKRWPRIYSSPCEPIVIFKLEDLEPFHETFPVSETHNAGARSVGQKECFWPGTCRRASNKAC